MLTATDWFRGGSEFGSRHWHDLPRPTINQKPRWLMGAEWRIVRSMAWTTIMISCSLKIVFFKLCIWLHIWESLVVRRKNTAYCAHYLRTYGYSSHDRNATRIHHFRNVWYMLWICGTMLNLFEESPCFCAIVYTCIAIHDYKWVF